MDAAARQRTRALVASLIGSSIEWYDYYLYGSVVSLVFARRFFPAADPSVGLLLAWASFAIPFFFRPLGGVIFSHLGDRVGRKVSLVLTLTLMGTATVLIGCLPDYSQIGVAAPILLVILRLVQGFGIGGEWGGALLLAVEHAGPHNRGLYGSIPQMGVTVGMLLGTIAVALVGRLPEAAFQSWGWRVPFLASAVLVFVGLWIRRGIEETPAFRAVKERGQVARLPIVETLRHHWRAVLLTIGLKIVETSPFYVFSTFVIAYATEQVGIGRVAILNAVSLASGAGRSTSPAPSASSCSRSRTSGCWGRAARCGSRWRPSSASACCGRRSRRCSARSTPRSSRPRCATPASRSVTRSAPRSPAAPPPSSRPRCSRPRADRPRRSPCT
jgi:MFS family permease